MLEANNLSCIKIFNSYCNFCMCEKEHYMPNADLKNG